MPRTRRRPIRLEKEGRVSNRFRLGQGERTASFPEKETMSSMEIWGRFPACKSARRSTNVLPLNRGMLLPFATVDSFQTFEGLLFEPSARLGVRASDWRGRSCECHCHPGDSDPTSELAAPSAPFTCGRPIGNPVLRAQRSIKARIRASPLACNQPQVPLTACRPAGALPQRGCHVNETSSTRLIPTFDLPPLIHLAALLNHSFGSLIYRVPLPLLHTENLRVRRPP